MPLRISGGCDDCNDRSGLVNVLLIKGLDKTVSPKCICGIGLTITTYFFFLFIITSNNNK